MFRLVFVSPSRLFKFGSPYFPADSKLINGPIRKFVTSANLNVSSAISLSELREGARAGDPHRTYNLHTYAAPHVHCHHQRTEKRAKLSKQGKINPNRERLIRRHWLRGKLGESRRRRRGGLAACSATVV